MSDWESDLMSRPSFSPDEQYLVDFLKSPTASDAANVYMWSYVVGGAALACCAAYHNSVDLLVVAFIVVIGFRLYEERHQRRYIPVWRAVIEKYEAAIEETDMSQSVEAPHNDARHGASDGKCPNDCKFPNDGNAG